MTCLQCGCVCSDGAAFCSNCGAPLTVQTPTTENNAQQPIYDPSAYQQPGQGYYQQPPAYQQPVYQQPTAPVSDDAPHFGFALLGFFVPIVGLILFLVWQSEKPKRAASAGKGALIGFIVSIVSSVLVSVLYVDIWFVLIGILGVL